MTPERLEYLQKLLLFHRPDWLNLTSYTVRVPSPSANGEVLPDNVVRLSDYRRIVYESHEDHIAIFGPEGLQITPSLPVRWIEAEGHVVTAWGLTEEADPVAEDMIGMESPLASPPPSRKRKG